MTNKNKKSNRLKNQIEEMKLKLKEAEREEKEAEEKRLVGEYYLVSKLFSDPKFLALLEDGGADKAKTRDVVAGGFIDLLKLKNSGEVKSKAKSFFKLKNDGDKAIASAVKPSVKPTPLENNKPTSNE